MANVGDDVQSSNSDRDPSDEGANIKPRHLAIFTQMGNGHVFPILPLCAELNARGHRISCAVTGRYVERIRAVGAEAVVFTETPVDTELQLENERRAEGPPSDASRFEVSDLEWSHICRSTESFISQVMGFYERNPPDLVLYNRYCIPGLIVARTLRAPAVQFSPHFAYPGRSRYWDRGNPRTPAGLTNYGEKLDSLLGAYGLTGAHHLWHLEQLNVHLIPREFQYQADVFDDRFFFAGSLLDRPYERCWDSSDIRKPIVLISGYSGLPETVSKSSNEGYFRLMIEALADSECHCVLSIGDSVSAKSFGTLPANFEVNQTASHLEILPRASLLVCHAGMSSSLEALYNAVPVLAIPSSPYTQEVADRLAQLQVGRALPRMDLRAAVIRKTVMEMLEDATLRNKARDIQEVFRRSSGATATAQRIEGLLHSAQRDERRGNGPSAIQTITERDQHALVERVPETATFE